MSEDRRPERSSVALGVMWASRITGLAAELFVPLIGGYYVDQRWHTDPLGILVGAVLGFSAMMVHVLALARQGTGN